ncbi:hypothetical protein [Halobacteriovorax sp. HLS]|uniref:hypothetical protein n=1 Tax=Halobacteriovorax sp. HLS TaxID=2234000 RepID=UPI000FDC36DA|nr:hypothetical protein [Halobacteriovorax sp. HLS]
MKNVLNLNNYTELKEEKSLMKYLKVLNFHDLMVEAEEALKELNNGKLNKEVSLRSKTIIKEFTNRLKGDSDVFSNGLTVINENLEKNFGKIKDIL